MNVALIQVKMLVRAIMAVFLEFFFKVSKT